MAKAPTLPAKHDLWWTVDDPRTLSRNVVVSPTLPQQQTLLSMATYNFMVGGWKCGKTSWGPVFTLTQMSRFPGENFLVTAPTYSAMNDIIVPIVKAFAENTRFKGEFNKADMTYNTPYGSIFFKSAQKPELIQGRHVCGAWADEVAQYTRLAWRHVKSRIDMEGARLLGTTTPYGENWFYDDPYQHFLDGNPEYRFWRLLSIDNPSYDRSVWDRDLVDMTKDDFMMYHMGLFRRRSGLVYPDFSRDRHVGVVTIDPTQSCVAGMDFGWGDNTVFKVGQYRPPSPTQRELWQFPDEYVESNQTMRDHARSIAPLIEKYNVRRVYYDYHGAQAAADLSAELKSTYHLAPDWIPVVETIRPGWEEMTRLLRNDAVLESSTNEDSLDEYAAYVIAKNGQPEQRDHNHCMDATRYMVDGERQFLGVMDAVEEDADTRPWHAGGRVMTEAERHIRAVAGDLDESLDEDGEYSNLGAF